MKPNPQLQLLIYKLLQTLKPNSKTLLIGETTQALLPIFQPHFPTIKNLCPKTLAKNPTEEKFDSIVIPNSLPEAEDIQNFLESLHTISHSKTRLYIGHQNNLWQPKLNSTKNTWISRQDLKTLCTLSGWEAFKTDGATLLSSLSQLAEPINRWLAPCLPALQKNLITICRKSIPRQANLISIIIPVRNEAGNLHTTLPRIPHFSCPTEILFVEGHSKDTTWETLQNLPKSHENRPITLLQQPGKGKGDAVRHGFAHANGDLLIILDGDLTMPPEELPKFVNAMESGITDFANGSRLVYLMEKQAMKRANLVANKGFGLSLSFILKQPIKDTLCGTKVLWKEDYEDIAANRAYFGELDPFGDFDLLFGAARLNLKILDIPIHYKERTYGETNIHRWRHGLLLAKMLLLAAKKLQFHTTQPTQKPKETSQNHIRE